MFEEIIEIIMIGLLVFGVTPSTYKVEEPHTESISLERIRLFLQKDQTDNNIWIESTFDCDDFAIMLRDNAKKENLDIEVVFMTYNEYFKYFKVIPTGNYLYHILNMTIVDGFAYLIEPQSDTLVPFGPLD
jgi:hypothetical protein